MIACPDCGAVQIVPVLDRRSEALCTGCHGRLEAAAGRSVDAAMACAAATFLLLFPANLLPLIHVRMLGVARETLLASGVVQMWRQAWVIPAALISAFAVLLPFVRFGLLSLCLACVRLGPRPSWLGRAFRWAMALDQWAMPDVFLIGCFVGYSRVAAELPTGVGPGGWCFIAAALLCMVSRAALDQRTVWRAIAPERSYGPGVQVISCTACALVAPAEEEGRPCPRCAQKLRARKPDALIRTTALCLAGFVLYWPANLYPMSRTEQLGRMVPHRIIDGIRELIQAGLWPLAVLIFCTSIAIPVLKLAGLAWFLHSVHTGSSRRLVLKTSTYRVIDEIGRWSNVDVFTIAVFTPLLQFEGLVSSHTAPGADAFMLVVVLTMLASRAFDPRLMWDAAGRAAA